MIWGWRISFRVVFRVFRSWAIFVLLHAMALPAVLVLLPVKALAASVSGEVELTNSKDAAVRRRRDYSGVVIWLEPVDHAAPAAPPKHVEMLQKEKQFVPHVVAL